MLVRGETTPASTLQMSNNALLQATSWESLNSAWKTLFRKSRPSSRNSVGIDDISINDFARDDAANINRLHREIREKQFHFSHLRPHLIQKPNGKDRLICVPTVKDRIVQRALLEFLSNKYHGRLANEISYGFVKYRSVGTAAKLACALRGRHQWAFKTDITSFFDTVNRSVLAQAISKNIRDSSLHALLLGALSCEVHCTSSGDRKRIKKLGIKEGLGIRQGMPLSPIFANLLLLQFDKAVNAKQYKCVRYADDLIFFADSRAECEEIAEFCTNELKKINLTIPSIEEKSKSIIYEPHAPAEFLGVGLCFENSEYVLRLMPNQLEKIREGLLQLGSIKELLNRNIKLASLGQAIVSRKSGYVHAYSDCVNADKLDNELSDIQQKVLKRIYVNGLKIDIENLAHEERTFLGLT